MLSFSGGLADNFLFTYWIEGQMQEFRNKLDRKQITICKACGYDLKLSSLVLYMVAGATRWRRRVVVVFEADGCSAASAAPTSTCGRSASSCAGRGCCAASAAPTSGTATTSMIPPPTARLPGIVWGGGSRDSFGRLSSLSDL